MAWVCVRTAGARAGGAEGAGGAKGGRGGLSRGRFDRGATAERKQSTTHSFRCLVVRAGYRLHFGCIRDLHANLYAYLHAYLHAYSHVHLHAHLHAYLHAYSLR